MKYAIITGASRGLGEAVAKRMLEEGISVISVSRTENESLSELAKEKNVPYKHLSCNLSLDKEIQEVFSDIAFSLFQKNPEKIYIINNAGMVEPIETAGNLDQIPVLRNIQVNLIAPILIANIFFKKAQNSDTTILAVNVTSGAGERPIESWSVYCSSKAGLNMFTRTAALEQESLGTGNQIIAFNPGVMDTGMQETIRSAPKASFKDLERFQEYKEKGLLRDAAVVGNALADVILGDSVINGQIYNINELLK
ncbi:(S)-benzoin forming benzil reductase [Neobacillus sp. PS3-34]|uniref:(S)-benzoin forming benzil reductase n=1 Tax=Neobacillus sp. PS3-34 TaxID=3070678 RepID=UPI0027E11238|nr:(S)-benzoin forming benzil reductase [Neobacillus sp. PS3-34]WML47029.1 (S)-benzoin forming benzil reductase [Neobacillus sp. PS3-34]